MGAPGGLPASLSPRITHEPTYWPWRGEHDTPVGIPRNLEFVSNNAIKFKLTDFWLRFAQNIAALSNTVTLTKRITGIFATSEFHFITRCWIEEEFRFYHLSPQSVHRPPQRLSNVFILWQFGVAVKITLPKNVSHAIKL